MCSRRVRGAISPHVLVAPRAAVAVGRQGTEELGTELTNTGSGGALHTPGARCSEAQGFWFLHTLSDTGWTPAFPAHLLGSATWELEWHLTGTFLPLRWVSLCPHCGSVFSALVAWWPFV